MDNIQALYNLNHFIWSIADRRFPFPLDLESISGYFFILGLWSIRILFVSMPKLQHMWSSQILILTISPKICPFINKINWLMFQWITLNEAQFSYIFYFGIRVCAHDGYWILSDSIDYLSNIMINKRRLNYIRRNIVLENIFIVFGCWWWSWIIMNYETIFDFYLTVGSGAWFCKCGCYHLVYANIFLQMNEIKIPLILSDTI